MRDELSWYSTDLRTFNNQQVPAAWAIAFLPHLYATSICPKSFDLRAPRTLSNNLKDDQTLEEAVGPFSLLDVMQIDK